MSNLSSEIAELLVTRDCVIVPDFGAFLANETSAKHSEISHKFTPPRRQFSFNPKLIQNDGMLIQHLSEVKHITYNQAKQLVSNELDVWKKTLEQKKTLTLTKLGVLKKQESSNALLFEPENKALNALTSFGLKTFHKIPVASPVEISTAETEPTISQQTLSKTRSRKAWKYAAAALALPILGYAAYIAAGTDLLKSNGHFAVADLNPFTEKICPEYSLRSIKPEVFNAVTFDSAADDSVLILTEKSTGIPIKSIKFNSESVSEKAMNYHVIAGCFGNEINAKNLVEDLKRAGYQASIVDYHKGLYRVSASGSTTRNNAENAMITIKATVAPSAWILKK